MEYLSGGQGAQRAQTSQVQASPAEATVRSAGRSSLGSSLSTAGGKVTVVMAWSRSSASRSGSGRSTSRDAAGQHQPTVAPPAANSTASASRQQQTDRAGAPSARMMPISRRRSCAAFEKTRPSSRSDTPSRHP
ncbi:MAG TPA: hypothetical protein PLJ35_07410 [Anaerolineae bacterium]|nr:hypothetical protein [Anaerolineae bacterium]HOQ98634.1 hypothetical protein [Anaerolineae bacterium]HPL28247.1 hypothetical protein [Anaerolineae bacterium]